ncbi:MAG: hypothetical protein HKO09_09710 [Croceitalea sp.]|nr:hypothetical protein [Croceitalea sp.]
MKKFISNLMYLGLVTMALTFTSCQEEFEEINGGDEQETITANSTTAQLISNTSSNDGSFDNIVDGASCLAIDFPYTVEVAGIQLTIDSVEDLQLIERIFDEFDDDLDELDILFPITITLGDFSQVTIENKEALRELAAECKEGGDDDDIECIDFVYPITIFTFDINQQQTGRVIVNSDRELRRFFAGLEDNDLVSLDFPITLKKADGTEIQVSNNAELAIALERAKNECDEDDDDDYNDDDFTLERLNEYLVECPWEVREIKRDAISLADQYLEYLMTFTQDGIVKVKDRAGNSLTGQWTTTMTDRGVVLSLSFDVLVDFNLEWLVYEIDEYKIKLYGGEGNKIILRQLCEDDNGGDDPDGTDVNPDTLREVLKECAWVIKKVANQGFEIDRLLGFEFKFMAEGVVTLSNGITVSDGTWEIGYNSEQKLALMIEFGDEPSINFEWPLSDLRNDRLEFEIPEIGYELKLQRVCDENTNDGDVPEIRNIMMGGEWNVASFIEEDVDFSTQYVGFDFNFSMFNQVEVSVNDDPIDAGLWRILRNADNQLMCYLNFGEEGQIFSDLTEAWYISAVSNERIELVYEDEQEVKILVFEKKQ